MSDSEKIIFDAACGEGLKVAGFINPSNASEIKGVIQICHGMSEYYSRYAPMIEHFNMESISTWPDITFAESI